MSKLCLVFSLLLFHSLIGKVHFYIPSPSIQRFSFKEVCKISSFKNSLLINPLGLEHLECMDRSVSLLKFCLSLKIKTPLLRVFIDLPSRQVICQRGFEAKLTIPCKESLCKNHHNSCIILKKIYGYELDLIHSFIDERFLSKKLTCYYSQLKERIFK